jgi:CHAD domain-containing protein
MLQVASIPDDGREKMEMEYKVAAPAKHDNEEYDEDEHGQAVSPPQELQVVKAARLRLRSSMSLEQAFEAIVTNCLEQVEGNEQGVIHGKDPESVHQMRVGLRRLRSAFDLFENVIECPKVLQAEWKWIGAQLGVARDWEVLADSTLEHLAWELPPHIDVAALKQSALEQARKNREQAAQAVQSTRYMQLKQHFMEWLDSKGWRNSQFDRTASLIDMPVKKFARQAMRHGESRLLKRGKQLKQNEPESRHRVRIASKKARYATEFLQSLFPKKQVRNYVSTLSDLQQELGWLNDAAVAMRMLDQIQVLDQPVAATAEFARGYMYASIHGDHPRLLKLWKRFAKVPPPYANR